VNHHGHNQSEEQEQKPRFDATSHHPRDRAEGKDTYDNNDSDKYGADIMQIEAGLVIGSDSADYMEVKMSGPGGTEAKSTDAPGSNLASLEHLPLW